MRSTGLRSFLGFAPDPREISFELVGDLVDASFRACLILFAARRTGDPNRTDDLLAGFDRQRTLRRDDPRKVYSSEGRVVLHPLYEFARRDAKRTSGIGFTLAVLHCMRRGAIAAHRDENLAIAPE